MAVRYCRLSVPILWPRIGQHTTKITIKLIESLRTNELLCGLQALLDHAYKWNGILSLHPFIERTKKILIQTHIAEKSVFQSISIYIDALIVLAHTKCSHPNELCCRFDSITARNNKIHWNCPEKSIIFLLIIYCILFFFSCPIRMSTTRWNSVRKKASYHSSNWMARRLPTQPSSSVNWPPNSIKTWMRAWHKSSAASPMPPHLWSRTICCGCYYTGAPKIPIKLSKAMKLICSTPSVAHGRIAFWNSSSALHTDAR